MLNGFGGSLIIACWEVVVTNDQLGLDDLSLVEIVILMFMLLDSRVQVFLVDDCHCIQIRRGGWSDGVTESPEDQLWS